MLDKAMGKARDFVKEHDDEIKATAALAGMAVAYVAFAGLVGHVFGKMYARAYLAELAKLAL